MKKLFLALLTVFFIGIGLLLSIPPVRRPYNPISGNFDYILKTSSIPLSGLLGGATAEVAIENLSLSSGNYATTTQVNSTYSWVLSGGATVYGPALPIAQSTTTIFNLITIATITPNNTNYVNLGSAIQTKVGGFNTSGNIGIGTTGPRAALEIGGSGAILIPNNITLLGRNAANNGNVDLIAAGGDNTSLFIYGNGASPGGGLYKSGSGFKVFIDTTNDNLVVGGTNLIGSSRLDVVNGSITVRGTNSRIAIGAMDVGTAISTTSLTSTLFIATASQSIAEWVQFKTTGQAQIQNWVVARDTTASQAQVNSTYTALANSITSQLQANSTSTLTIASMTLLLGNLDVKQLGVSSAAASYAGSPTTSGAGAAGRVVGWQFSIVGSSPIYLTHFGSLVGFTTTTHRTGIFDAQKNLLQAVNVTTINCIADGQFCYTPTSSPILLAPGTSYTIAQTQPDNETYYRLFSVPVATGNYVSDFRWDGGRQGVSPDLQYPDFFSLDPTGTYFGPSFKFSKAQTSFFISGATGAVTIGTWQGAPVAIAYGGTGSTTAAGALTNLGAVTLTSTQTFSGKNTFAGLVTISSALGVGPVDSGLGGQINLFPTTGYSTMTLQAIQNNLEIYLTTTASTGKIWMFNDGGASPFELDVLGNTMLGSLASPGSRLDVVGGSITVHGTNSRIGIGAMDIGTAISTTGAGVAEWQSFRSTGQAQIAEWNNFKSTGQGAIQSWVVARGTTSSISQVTSTFNACIQIGTTLQSGTTFFTSSGTANSLYQAGFSVLDISGSTQTKTGGLNVMGNVGIGTTNPGAPLDVLQKNGSSVRIFGNSNPVVTFVSTATNGEHSTLAAVTGNGNYSDIAMSSDVVLRSLGGSVIFTAYNASGDLKFTTGLGDTAKMIVKNGGNVGIGTTNPDIALRVYKTGDAQIGVTDTNNSVDTRMTALGASNVGIVGTFSNHDLVIDSNGSEKVRIQTGGNVGIGTTSPDAKFEVSGGSIEIHIGSTYRIKQNDNFHGMGYFNTDWVSGDSIDGPVLFGFAGGRLGTTTGSRSSILAWTSNAVGIGTTNPSSKFQVAGTTIPSVFAVTASGLIISSGVAVSLVNCGTGSTINPGSTYKAGSFVVGIGPTTCQLFWAPAFPTSAFCHCEDDTVVGTVHATNQLKNGFTVTGTISLNDTISWWCDGN